MHVAEWSPASSVARVRALGEALRVCDTDAASALPASCEFTLKKTHPGAKLGKRASFDPSPERCSLVEDRLVHLSDESAHLDSFYTPWSLVLRKYYDERLAVRWPRTLAFLPLGYCPGARQSISTQVELVSTSARALNWSFFGNAPLRGGEPTRRAKLAVFDEQAPAAAPVDLVNIYQICFFFAF